MSDAGLREIFFIDALTKELLTGRPMLGEVLLATEKLFQRQPMPVDRLYDTWFQRIQELRRLEEILCPLYSTAFAVQLPKLAELARRAGSQSWLAELARRAGSQRPLAVTDRRRCVDYHVWRASKDDGRNKLKLVLHGEIAAQRLLSTNSCIRACPIRGQLPANSPLRQCHIFANDANVNETIGD